jgi:AsmA protein
LPERGDAARRTTFSSLSASGSVEDALLTNRDLKGVLDFMTITGTGTVNLLDDMINFDLTAAIVDGPKLQSDPAMVKYAGQSLPLRVTGTVDAPSVLPDFGAVVRQRVTNEVNQAVEEQRTEVEQRVDEQKDEARDRLRGRLRGLLDRGEPAPAPEPAPANPPQ